MNALGSMHDYYSARSAYMATDLGKEPHPRVQEIIAELKAQAQGRAVLEIACGTGNWTRLVAPCARRATALDYSDAMLDVARSRPIANAHFLLANAYDLSGLGDESYDFGYAMWLVSHLALSRWHEFITSFHAHLKPGATVMFADDIRRPDDGDTWYSKLATRDSYEIRQLPNGHSYEIVKTYFTPEDLRTLLRPYADKLQIRYERPFWWLTYEVREG